MPRLKAKRPVDRRVRFRAIVGVVLLSGEERERTPETYREGRRCRRCGCRLSIYHPDPDCWPCLARSGKGKPSTQGAGKLRAGGLVIRRKRIDRAGIRRR